MNKSTRAAAVAAVIDHKIRTLGGDAMAINACIAVGLASLKYDPSSACRAIERAVSAGADIIDGGAPC